MIVKRSCHAPCIYRDISPRKHRYLKNTVSQYFLEIDGAIGGREQVADWKITRATRFKVSARDSNIVRGYMALSLCESIPQNEIAGREGRRKRTVSGRRKSPKSKGVEIFCEITRKMQEKNEIEGESGGGGSRQADRRTYVQTDRQPDKRGDRKYRDRKVGSEVNMSVDGTMIRP